MLPVDILDDLPDLVEFERVINDYRAIAKAGRKAGRSRQGETVLQPRITSSQHCPNESGIEMLENEEQCERGNDYRRTLGWANNTKRSACR